MEKASPQEYFEIEHVVGVIKICKGEATADFQYYQVVVTDCDDKEYLLTVGCKSYNQETFEKTMNKLYFVPAPTRDEIESNKIKNQGKLN